MVLVATVVLGFLIFIHEGGHYLASRAFGVRVTEFMIGLPGPTLAFRVGETRFGVTAIPLGGYARVCGMEAGEESPHLQAVLAALYVRGTANLEDIARDCGITDDEAYDALEELVEWGSCTGPQKTDEYNTYRAVAVSPTRRQQKRAQAAARTQYAGGAVEAPAPVVLPSYEEGEARPVPNAAFLYESERARQYRSLPFWKRTVILLAGIFMNLLFAMVAFVIIYSVIGFDYTFEDGTVQHVLIDPLRSIQAGFMYIGMVAQAVVNLFNPSTAAETVQNSTSIVGIAIMSKTAAEEGLVSLLSFTAMISVSLGIMNLLPIPPLDGGRFIIEIVQKISRRTMSARVVNSLTVAGVVLFLGFFVLMVGQDITRVFTGTFF